MLTDTEGIDFNDYLRRVYLAVRGNWYAVMPASVQLGVRAWCRCNSRLQEMDRCRMEIHRKCLVPGNSLWIEQHFH